MDMVFNVIDEIGGKEKAYYYITFAQIKITAFYKLSLFLSNAKLIASVGCVFRVMKV